MEPLLANALCDVREGNITSDTVAALKRCVVIAQYTCGCHITLLPADVHCCIAGHVMQGLSPHKIAKHAWKLLTFCSKITLAEMWHSCGCTLPVSAVGPCLRHIKTKVSHVINKISMDWTLAQQSREGCVILLTLQEPVSSNTDGVYTDVGSIVAYQRNYDDDRGRMYPIDIARLHHGQTIHISAHRCMLKRDARLRYGTYAPYEQQDFISIEFGSGRQHIHVIELGAHLYSASTTIQVR